MFESCPGIPQKKTASKNKNKNKIKWNNFKTFSHGKFMNSLLVWQKYEIHIYTCFSGSLTATGLRALFNVEGTKTHTQTLSGFYTYKIIRYLQDSCYKLFLISCKSDLVSLTKNEHSYWKSSGIILIYVFQFPHF